ncbi:MAG: hypothetical protein Kow0020_12420 [Wenzhouxiangellaceae bacterium]
MVQCSTGTRIGGGATGRGDDPAAASACIAVISSTAPAQCTDAPITQLKIAHSV